MPRQHIRIEDSFSAPPERVFALFADHERFGRLIGMPTKRTRVGDDPQAPNGVGSVRRLGAPGMTFDETVTAYEPPRLIEYTVSRGSPIKNHHGRMEFTATEDGGTRLIYTIDFDPRMPLTGGFIARVLRKGLRRGMDRVMAHI